MSANCWKYIFDWKTHCITLLKRTHPSTLETSSCKLLWKLNVAFNVPSNARLFYKYTAGFVRRFIHQMETCMPPCKALCYTSWHATVSNSAAVTFFERYVRYGTTHHATQSCIVNEFDGWIPIVSGRNVFCSVESNSVFQKFTKSETSITRVHHYIIRYL